MQFHRLPGRPGRQTWREFLAECRNAGLPSKTREDKAGLKSAWDYLERCIHYANETYHVAVDPTPEHAFDGVVLWHLSIKRHDREPMQDWRVLQAIKNAIVGEDVEAVELYPAESRVVDTSNQYHLYAFISGPDGEAPTLPFGFPTGSKCDDPNWGDAKQRPRGE